MRRIGWIIPAMLKNRLLPPSMKTGTTLAPARRITPAMCGTHSGSVISPPLPLIMRNLVAGKGGQHSARLQMFDGLAQRRDVMAGRAGRG